MITAQPLPFKEVDGKTELVGPVLLSCGCFTGDTIVKCRTGKAPLKSLTIKTLYERWQAGWWEKHQPLYVRGLHKQRVGITKVIDIMYMGRREVVRVSFADGTEIKCTPDHRFYTNNGWVKAQDMLGEMGMKDPVNIAHGYKQKHVSDPRVCVPDVHPYARKQTNTSNSTSNLMELHRAMFECYANGYETLDEWRKNMKKDSFFVDPKKFVVHHIDGDHSNNAQDNLCLLTDTAHKRLHALQEKEHGLAVPQPVECVSVEELGVEPVYDISCETYNSYTANGFVVHNCGSTTARWASIQQNLSTRVPQAKPKSSRMVNDWLTESGLREKLPVLKGHQYGVFVVPVGGELEALDIMPGTTMGVAQRIGELIRRHNEQSNHY